jgi:hypothetical protein
VRWHSAVCVCVRVCVCIDQFHICGHLLAPLHESVAVRASLCCLHTHITISGAWLFAFFTSGFSSSFDLFTVGTAAASMIRGIRVAAGNRRCRGWTQHIARPGGGHRNYFRWKDGGGVNVLIAVRNLSFFQKDEDNSKQPAKKVPAGGSGYGNGNSNFEEAARKSQNMALKATAMGAGLNLVLFVSKGITGYLVNSTALMADAFGSLGDLCTDAIVYYSVEQARKAASPDRPWGLGKMEPIGNHCVVVTNSNALLNVVISV